MKRKDFIKNLGLLGGIFIIPLKLLAKDKDKFQIWGCGFRQLDDKGIHYGFHNNKGEEFYIGYRTTADKSFDKSLAKEMNARFKDHKERYRNKYDKIIESVPVDKERYHQAMVKWMERLMSHWNKESPV